MSDLKFDQFKIKFFLIVSCLIVVAALVVTELFSSPSDEIQGGGGQLGSIFTGYVPLTSENPYHYTLFFGQLKTSSCSHLWIWFNFLTANLPIFFIPSYQNFLALKVSKLYDLIVVTILKMQPHYSRSSRENAAPFSGTSPSAYNKEMFSPPRGRISCQLAVIILMLFLFFHIRYCAWEGGPVSSTSWGSFSPVCYSSGFSLILERNVAVHTSWLDMALRFHRGICLWPGLYSFE